MKQKQQQSGDEKKKKKRKKKEEKKEDLEQRRHKRHGNKGDRPMTADVHKEDPRKRNQEGEWSPNSRTTEHEYGDGGACPERADTTNRNGVAPSVPRDGKTAGVRRAHPKMDKGAHEEEGEVVPTAKKNKTRHRDQQRCCGAKPARATHNQYRGTSEGTVPEPEASERGHGAEGPYNPGTRLALEGSQA